MDTFNDMASAINPQKGLYKWPNRRNVVMRDVENASAALTTVVKVPGTSLVQKSVPIDAERITE